MKHLQFSSDVIPVFHKIIVHNNSTKKKKMCYFNILNRSFLGLLLNLFHTYVKNFEINSCLSVTVHIFLHLSKD